ncbi:helix-turn-helix domain-containing protein [Vibrio agarivorans]|uniref:helix-turn-helix domain-containing protein n=1 Tax=Vibrio agarivorans TaxID=153622 RepID=UPI00222F8D61|nr:helix-turn-helix transcriptional regulator [Vibrio agarivorans]
MIKYKLQEQMELKKKRDNIKISQADVARAIGVQRAAISKLIVNKNYVTTTSTLDALCKFFDCQIEDLVEYVPDE